MTRQETLDWIKDKENVSVLVVGGGVNGIGTFRELALQGVDVLLVEMNDFSSGASAASSHMLHGGLRYLENAEFRLVKEALTERNRLLQNAPHQARPLPTTIPIFSWFSGILNAPLKFLNLLDKPGQRGAVVIKLGLTLYDLFTMGQQTLPRHVFHSRKNSLAKRPLLNPNIINTATYYDAWMPRPEAICMELIADAEAASPDAKAINYAKVVGGDGDTVTIQDQKTGENYSIKPQVVINAAGPWIDFANQEMNKQSHFIGGTKGSHLVIDHPELHEATQGNEMFFENDDGRITLFFPLQERVLVGTTDIRLDNPDEAVCTEEEIDYMLDMVKVVFPNIEVNRSHIVFTFSGVRPLPASDANTTGQISRDHSIKTLEAGNGLNFPILSLVGGKWTTFRAFSEHTADEVLKRLGVRRKVDTKDTPIGGGKNYPKGSEQKWLTEQHQKLGIDRDRLETLFDRYGTDAIKIVDYIKAGDDKPLGGHAGYSTRELMYLAETTKVVHLDDLLLRRSLLAMLGYANMEFLEEVANTIAETLGWSADDVQREVERAATIFSKQNRMQYSNPQTA